MLNSNVFLLMSSRQMNKRDQSNESLYMTTQKFHNAIKTSNPIDAEKFYSANLAKISSPNCTKWWSPKLLCFNPKKHKRYLRSRDQSIAQIRTIKCMVVKTSRRQFYSVSKPWCMAHTFTESFQVLPADTGFTINFNMQFKDNAIAYLDYLVDDISPNPSGIGVVI